MKSKTNIKLRLALSLVGVVLLSSLFGGCALFDGEDDEPETRQPITVSRTALSAYMPRTAR